MSENRTITVRLSEATLDLLNRFAKETRRTRNSLAAEAIEELVSKNAWQVEETRKAALKADAGGPFVAHEEVTAWLETWGSNEELPPPKATVKR